MYKRSHYLPSESPSSCLGPPLGIHYWSVWTEFFSIGGPITTYIKLKHKIESQCDDQTDMLEFCAQKENWQGTFFALTKNQGCYRTVIHQVGDAFTEKCTFRYPELASTVLEGEDNGKNR